MYPLEMGAGEEGYLCVSTGDGGRGGRGVLCDPLGMGQRRVGNCSRFSAAELGMRLGDWSKERGEDVKLACLLPWLEWSGSSQGMLGGVWVWYKAMSSGRKVRSEVSV